MNEDKDVCATFQNSSPKIYIHTYLDPPLGETGDATSSSCLGAIRGSLESSAEEPPSKEPGFWRPEDRLLPSLCKVINVVVNLVGHL